MEKTSLIFVFVLFVFLIGCEATPKRSLVIIDPLQRGQYEFVKNREECWRYARGVQERLRDHYQREWTTSAVASFLQGMNIERSYKDTFRECIKIKGYYYEWKYEDTQ